MQILTLQGKKKRFHESCYSSRNNLKCYFCLPHFASPRPRYPQVLYHSLFIFLIWICSWPSYLLTSVP
ncbi:hypothetical protein BDV29DRAFT_6926 [Aspergillus leporis]|uniref:Uncharacterized protein n=1 Tax=Aspergillus leporis TaxID=41062 RepID=A0A5N5WWM8_9EURO|nr:hypothetical protein BDV29DRAFT_6926 [Aspergillus leporis]